MLHNSHFQALTVYVIVFKHIKSGKLEYNECYIGYITINGDIFGKMIILSCYGLNFLC